MSRIREETELQGARWRRDELGHEPLSYDREIRVGGQVQLEPGLLDAPADDPRVHAEHAGDVRERPLQDVEDRLERDEEPD